MYYEVFMRVLVCGGRDFRDERLMWDKLDELLFHSPWTGMTIIHGAARGADLLAGKYAKVQEYEVEVYPADWEQHGKSAGVIRNQVMLDQGKPDFVVAFPGGRGTAHMVSIAKKAGFKVIEVK